MGCGVGSGVFRVVLCCFVPVFVLFVILCGAATPRIGVYVPVAPSMFRHVIHVCFRVDNRRFVVAVRCWGLVFVGVGFFVFV